MSNEIFAALIIIGLFIAFGFYTAGLWISFKSKSHHAFMPPLPPRMPDLKASRNAKKNKRKKER